MTTVRFGVNQNIFGTSWWWTKDDEWELGMVADGTLGQREREDLDVDRWWKVYGGRRWVVWWSQWWTTVARAVGLLTEGRERRTHMGLRHFVQKNKIYSFSFQDSKSQGSNSKILLLCL